MNSARPSDGLLSAGDTLRLIEFVASRTDGGSIDRIIRDFLALVPASRSKALNTVHMLASSGTLILKDGLISAKNGSRTEENYKKIRVFLAQEFCSRLSREDGWSCVRREPQTDSLIVDYLILRGCDDGVAKWLVEFKVAKRPHPEARYWSIEAEFTDLLLSEAARNNENKIKSGRSIGQLRSRLEQQALDGEAAEHWVLEYEQRRLASHPFADQIRKISKENVSAGYDLISFSTEFSMVYDRFIEVKSHGPLKRFYWSRNEIDTAMQLGEKYALYLVDRTRFDDPNYHPHIITAPNLEMFETPGGKWLVEPTSFEMTMASD